MYAGSKYESHYTVWTAWISSRVRVRVGVYFTVWPEILAGRYFGGLLKICHLAEFTLAVEPVLAIMRHHTEKFLADEILADCSQNRQSAKINSPPKFPAIRYIAEFGAPWHYRTSY